MRKIRTNEQKMLKLLGERGKMSLRQIQRELGIKRYASLVEARKRLEEREFLKQETKPIHEKGGQEKPLSLTRQGLGNSVLNGANPSLVLKNAEKYKADPFSLVFLELCKERPKEMMRIMNEGFLPDKILNVIEDVSSIVPEMLVSFGKHPDIIDMLKGKYPKFYGRMTDALKRFGLEIV